MRRLCCAGILALLWPGLTWAGPFSSSGISASDPRFVGFATGVSSLVRGPQDITDPGIKLNDQSVQELIKAAVLHLVDDKGLKSVEQEVRKQHSGAASDMWPCAPLDDRVG